MVVLYDGDLKKMNKQEIRDKLDIVHVDDIMDYESGLMSEGDMINMFQKLINNGMAWTLQGHYGRTAQMLIDAGYCTM